MICFIVFWILTWKCPIAKIIMKSFISGENIKYVSCLRPKSSAKIIGLTEIVFLKGSSSIRFPEDGIYQHWQNRALQGRIDLLNRALGAAVQLLVAGLAIGVRTFEGGSKIFLVDVCSYLEAKNLRSAFGNSCWQ